MRSDILHGMKYMEIYSALKKSIAEREFAPARKLPGETKLCKRFAAARNTIRQALSLLHSQGLIEKRKGEGTFITKRGERKTGLIGIFIPDYDSSSFFASLKKELESIAQKKGYRIHLEPIACKNKIPSEQILRRAARKMAARRVEGVIFRPLLDVRRTETNKEILNIFLHAETPVVLIDSDITQRPERSSCDLIAVDNVSAGRRIAAHLLETGRKKIAFMMSGLEICSNENWGNRLFGIAGEVAVNGIDHGVSTLKFHPNDTDSLRTLFKSHRRPDAIACGNDRTASVLIENLKSIGIKIPQDIAVTGFDDESFARSSIPPLTTIRQPISLIAKTAFKTLLARIRYPNNDPREILLDAPLIIRKST